MRRLRLLVEYDGTDFSGFQRQREQPSIQSALEYRLSEICGHLVTVHPAGRTDAGVHALGQVIHFDTTGSVPVKRLDHAVNSRIEPGIVVRFAEEAPPDFHARYSALRRTYHYYLTGTQPSPMLARYVSSFWGLRAEAEERMRAALHSLQGTHDFATFGMAGAETRTTVRTLYTARLDRIGPLLRVELTADGFLHSMVRRIVGLLGEIGRGWREPEQMEHALAARNPRVQWRTAPPEGLFLVRVEYPDRYPREAAEESAASGAPERLLSFGRDTGASGEAPGAGENAR